MKYIFILSAFISIMASAQTNNIDTVYVRNLQMQAGDWSYLVGKTVSRATDSTTMTSLRKIRAAILVANPSTFGTNVTIDSVPGVLMLEWYKIIWDAPYSELSTRGSAMVGAITGKVVLTTHIQAINADRGDPFVQERRKGKSFLMDN